ncbi:von Willebrand factor A domain-containing protein 5B1-like isoform X2 [Polyodon spathula]|uniref:von Willebrand factor A domain-containing protein 5B1-like isoform X2 n=1 Tax=Polyodon spathula TaxID=7913 RepID=UPI001B7DC77C|nr:von Willebrand factor A domain-containing protein 5B1-like isoform X2 [Polyodon spathula]
MPGLLNRSSWAPLLLKASCVKSCANGYFLGLNAQLTYTNPDSEPVEGVFVYPLQEREVVVGFEAVTAGRVLSVQIQSRTKPEDCCLDCCRSSSLELQCKNGHLILDEDMERTTFIVGTGVISPLDIVTVIISTTQELPTLENGAIHLLFPSVFTPIVTGETVQSKSESGVRCDENGPTSCFRAAPGKQDKPSDSAHSVFTRQATNPQPYEMNFELLVRGACLLAGLESPTHALRADGDPSAKSASATYITLAEEHPYNCNLEIILHLSEPHTPHVLLEEGRLTFQEYEQHIRGRRDFIHCSRKEADSDKRLEFVRKRFHKDILLNPVLMLNFCPDLRGTPGDIHRVTRELVFLVDRSGSMSGANIHKIKEAMIVAIKSLPSRTLLNIVGFGSNIKSLFSTSRVYSEDTLSLACEYLQKMRADMGGTNILGALNWVFQQPVHRGYPRQLFILTDGKAINAGKVIELVRRHASTARCFSVGLGPHACRRLLRGVSRVTGGTAEFLSDSERVQPKLIKSLKKALEPALSDVRIDWYVPDNVEALLSPNEIAPLYPGDRLIGYCTVYDVSAFRSKKAGIQGHSYTSLYYQYPRLSSHCQQSKARGSKGQAQGSVSSLSQDDLSAPLAGEVCCPSERSDIEEALREISREISSEFSCASTADAGGELDFSSDICRRILQSSYIQEQYILTRCSVSSESPSSREITMETGSLPQGLEKVSQQGPRSLSRWESPWKPPPQTEARGVKPEVTMASGSSEEAQRKQRSLARSALSSRSFSSPQGELDMHRLRRALEKVSFDQVMGGRLEESDGETHSTPRKSLTGSNSLLFPASPLDWDAFTDPEFLFSALPPEEAAPRGTDAPVMHCRSLIHGLIGGEPVSWEATASLVPLFAPRVTSSQGDGWDEMGHQLTARSVIQDFEIMAEKAVEINHGPAKRNRLKAIQTSKGCNTISMYTTFAVVDSSTQKGLPASVEVHNAGVRFGPRRSSHSGSRRQRVYSMGLGRRPSSRDSEELDDAFAPTERDDTPASPCSMNSWDSSLGGSWYPSSPSAMSVQSQPSVESKSVESFFGSRFSLSRFRGSSSSGKPPPLKPQCVSAEMEESPETETTDYLSLVRLQLASGAFLLNDLYSEQVQIPLERLKRASPFSSHRSSLSPPSRCTSPRAAAGSTPKPTLSQQEPGSLKTNNPRTTRGLFTERDAIALLDPALTSAPDFNGVLQQADSGRGSETDVCEGSPVQSEAGVAPFDLSSEQRAERDLEGSSWATAVALAWLEHRCAGFFVEWELVAAKADSWLRAQQLPEGMDQASLKGAAHQLFLLLRHWDENIKLNILCYNPNNM